MESKQGPIAAFSECFWSDLAGISSHEKLIGPPIHISLERTPSTLVLKLDDQGVPLQHAKRCPAALSTYLAKDISTEKRRVRTGVSCAFYCTLCPFI